MRKGSLSRCLLSIGCCDVVDKLVLSTLIRFTVCLDGCRSWIARLPRASHRHALHVPVLLLGLHMPLVVIESC